MEPITDPAAYDDAGHELDPETGEPIHLDVDPIIPTGLCRYC